MLLGYAVLHVMSRLDTAEGNNPRGKKKLFVNKKRSAKGNVDFVVVSCYCLYRIELRDGGCYVYMCLGIVYELVI